MVGLIFGGIEMCLAIPGTVTGVDGDIAAVDYGGVSVKANVCLCEGVKAGDKVLVHAGFVIQVLDEEAGRELEALLNETAALF